MTTKLRYVQRLKPVWTTRHMKILQWIIMTLMQFYKLIIKWF